ncbi:hypothetical protein GCM10018775_92120 [Streptomyces umbrinus]|nr:hypothetical protein GCM10018775_92120 [Streptomyces umbrinus]
MPSSAVSALQAGSPHQPRDTSAAASGACPLEHGMDARGAIGSPRSRVDVGDLFRQLGVTDRAGIGGVSERKPYQSDLTDE